MTYGVPEEDEVRYRVVEVLYVSEDGRVVTTGDIEEFKTPVGADACRNRWKRAGKSVTIQVGKLHWLANDELELPSE